MRQIYERKVAVLNRGGLATEVKDERVIRLIRKYLKSGVMINGLISPTTEGTPQGGNLSPLLSNIYLTAFDRMLENRGHKFVRYADDCNIYVKSRRAAERVMAIEAKGQQEEKSGGVTTQTKISWLFNVQDRKESRNTPTQQKH